MDIIMQENVFGITKLRVFGQAVCILFFISRSSGYYNSGMCIHCPYSLYRPFYLCTEASRCKEKEFGKSYAYQCRSKTGRGRLILYIDIVSDPHVCSITCNEFVLSNSILSIYSPLIKYVILIYLQLFNGICF